MMLHGLLCSDLPALYNDGYNVISPVSMSSKVTGLGIFCSEHSCCGLIGFLAVVQATAVFLSECLSVTVSSSYSLL